MLHHHWLIQEHKEAMITWHCSTGHSHTSARLPAKSPDSQQPPLLQRTRYGKRFSYLLCLLILKMPTVTLSTKHNSVNINANRNHPQQSGSADWTPEFQLGCVSLGFVRSFVVDWGFSWISCATYLPYMDQTSSFSSFNQTQKNLQDVLNVRLMFQCASLVISMEKLPLLGGGGQEREGRKL